MTATVIQFPRSARVASVRISCGLDGWLVVEPGGYAWPVSTRDDAVLKAFATARELGVRVVEDFP